MMKLSRVWLVCVVIGLGSAAVGCDRTSSPEFVSPQQHQAVAVQEHKTLFPRNDWACTPESSKRISNWFDQWIEHGASQLAVNADVLVQRDGKNFDALHLEPILELGVDTWTYEGILIESWQDLQYQIAYSRRSHEEFIARGGNQEQRPFKVSVAIAKDVPLERVEKLLFTMSRERVTEIDFVFKAPEPPKDFEMMPADIEKRIQDLHREDEEYNGPGRLPQWDGPFFTARRNAAKKCQPIVKVWERLDTTVRAQMNLVMRGRLGDAWLDCKCKADIETLIGGFVVDSTKYPRARVRYVPMSLVDAAGLIGEREGIWGEFAIKEL